MYRGPTAVSDLFPIEIFASLPLSADDSSARLIVRRCDAISVTMYSTTGLSPLLEHKRAYFNYTITTAGRAGTWYTVVLIRENTIQASVLLYHSMVKHEGSEASPRETRLQ